MKTKLFLGLSSLIILAILSGCTDKRKELESATQESASVINQEFVNIRIAVNDFKTSIEGVVNNLGSLDLSTDKLDVSQGGLFKMFPENKYYYKTLAEGSCFYLSPGKPLEEGMKKELRIQQYLEPFAQKASATSKNIGMVFYGVHDPWTIAIMDPWIDVVSIFPPGVDLRYFEWYNRGLKSPGEALWSEKPFTDLATGWVMDVSVPIKTPDGIRGVSVISLNMSKLQRNFFQPRKDNLILLGSDLTIVGSTLGAKELLGIKLLEDFDFVKQMKENTFAPDEFKLASETQPPLVQEIAKKISTWGMELILWPYRWKKSPKLISISLAS